MGNAIALKVVASQAVILILGSLPIEPLTGFPFALVAYYFYVGDPLGTKASIGITTPGPALLTCNFNNKLANAGPIFSKEDYIWRACSVQRLIIFLYFRIFKLLVLC